MPVTKAVRESVLEHLNNKALVSDRGMFGGRVGLYCDGRFFALIGDDIPYFKVVDSNRADFEKAGMDPFMPFGPGKDTEITRRN